MIFDWMLDHAGAIILVFAVAITVAFGAALKHDDAQRDAQFHAALALAQDRRDTLNVVLAFHQAADAHEHDAGNAAMAGAAIGIAAGAAAAR